MQPVAAVEEAHSVLARLPGDSAKSARSLLRRALASESTPGIMVRPEEESAALALAACGILRLEEKAEGDAAVYHWRPYRAPRRRAPRRGPHPPRQAGPRRGTNGTHACHRGDAGTQPRTRPTVPGPARYAPASPGASATRTGAWSVYDAALRAAAGWHNAQRKGQPLSARELAAISLGWSKAWTEPRMLAFEHVIGKKFDDALETMEPEVRLRGPLSWFFGTTAVDARVARPWVSIPARSAQQYGTLDYSQTQGVLVIENLDTFEAICRHSTPPIPGSASGATGTSTTA